MHYSPFIRPYNGSWEQGLFTRILKCCGEYISIRKNKRTKKKVVGVRESKRRHCRIPVTLLQDT